MKNKEEKYTVQEIIDSVSKTSDEELSKNAEILTDEIIKTDKKYKICRISSRISVALAFVGMVSIYSVPSIAFVGLGLAIVGGIGFLCSRKLYKMYAKDLKALGYASNYIFEELMYRVENKDKRLRNKEAEEIFTDILKPKKLDYNSIDLESIKNFSI